MMESLLSDVTQSAAVCLVFFAGVIIALCTKVKCDPILVIFS